MRNAIVFLNICIVVGVTMLLLDFESYPPTPSVTSDKQQAKAVTTQSSLSGMAEASLASVKSVPVRTRLSENEMLYVKDFIQEMAQVRIMDREQSKLAVQRATTRPLKDYGSWMVLNQQQMLDDLNKLAARHGIATTTTLNETLTSDLSDLHKLHGKKFDMRYIKSLIAEHKRDLKRLERATYSKDPDVQVFATRYFSLAKDNLAKLQEIKRGR